MRRLALVALFVIAAPVLAGGPPHFEVRNTSDLVTLCATAPGDAQYTSAIAFCHGFGTGAYRYYEAATEAEDRFVCPSTPGPSRAEVLDEFLAWTKTHPEHMDKPAVNTLFRFLAERFPCKG